MDSTLLGVIITQVTTILIASGGWYFGARKDREKTRKLMESEIQGLKEDVTDMGANLQQKIALIDLQIGTLSERVEKHNSVIERTYKLEQKVDDMRAKVG